MALGSPPICRRAAGADLAPPSRRGRAVSIVLVATALGAIIGPNLVSVTGDFASQVGVPRLAGPFILAGVAYASAGLVLWLCFAPTHCSWHRIAPHRPTVPMLTVMALRLMLLSGAHQVAANLVTSGRKRCHIMIITQVVMVAIMTMTPIHIEHYGHSLAITGVVIGAHVAGMFLPSPFSGWLVDRFGYRPIARGCRCDLAGGGPARRVGARGLGCHAGLRPRTARIGMEPRAS